MPKKMIGEKSKQNNITGVWHAHYLPSIPVSSRGNVEIFQAKLIRLKYFLYTPYYNLQTRLACLKISELMH